MCKVFRYLVTFGMTLNDINLLNLPEQYRPSIDDLPRDMGVLARILEEYFPEQGVLIVLVMAHRVGGGLFYVRKLNGLRCAWRNDTIRKMYDSGEYTAKALCRKWRLSQRTIENILYRTRGNKTCKK